MRKAIASCFLLLSVGWFGLPALAREDDSCTVTLEVRNCGGEAIADVELEIESGETRLRAVTDADGRAVFEVCADEVGDAFVYLIEGGFPMSATPIFEDDRSNPKEAKATVVVC
jgi:hypothetical protein